MIPLDEDDIMHPCSPPTHEDEEMISLNDAYDLMQNLFDIIDLHIDDFIQVGRRRWDFGYFIIDKDPIYDIEGSSQEEGVQMSSSEDWSSCLYDLDIWKPGDDMVTDWFPPLRG